MPRRMCWRAETARRQVADRSRSAAGSEIGEPVSQTLLGDSCRERTAWRSVHEPRGQTMSVRVALRG